jgi:predicted nucleic acid-binding protein
MFLFCPIGNSRKPEQKKYTAFFSQINSAKSCVWINSLVLSEFCNAWLRIAFTNWKKKPENIAKNDYKRDFVGSAIYKDTIQEITATLKKILKITERATDDFNAINLDHIFVELENCDFNDSYYLELASRKNWKIVTDDADLFKNNKLQVEIVTANL